MIYLDTCVVIYVVEKNPQYYEYLDGLFRRHAAMGFATSSLVALECLVGPLRRRDMALTEKFERFFAATKYLYLDDAVFRRAAEKRALYNI